MGRHLAALATPDPDKMLAALRTHILTETTLGVLVQVLGYVSPTHGGDALITECVRVLEVAFGVEVQGRRQAFPYTFRFLRYVGLIDDDQVPIDYAVREALGFDPDPYLDALAHITPAERTLLDALLRHAGTKWIAAEDLKRHIRDESGEILEVGKGGKGLAKRLKAAGFVEIKGGVGKGARDTKLRLKPGKKGLMTRFLQSPWAKAYLIRASFETGGLLSHLDRIVGGTLADLLADLEKQPDDGVLLELVAARIAFALRCRDIVIRSRQTAPDMPVEGEKDVIATIPKPFPTRLLIQCKAHADAMGTAVLYRELAIALLSTNVRTILFFSSSGYTPKTRMMQRLCMHAFPFLNLALFDGEDLAKLKSGHNVAALVYDRLDEVHALKLRMESQLTPRQLREVVHAMEEAGVDASTRSVVANALWPPIAK